MEFSKQGQAPVPNNIGSQPLPSSNVQSNQTERPSMFYPSSLPGDWSSQQMFSMGTSVPVSSYCIVPMNQQPVQLGASRPEISRPLGPQPLLSRVSLRPPQQVLNIHTSLPGMAGSQHSPSMAGRRSQQTIGSPKVQMLKSPSFQSSNKRSAQKEPPSKVQHQQLESVRSKFRESLVAALSLDSDQQNKIQSDNVQSAGSIDNFKPGAGDAVQDLVATTSKDVCTTNSGVDTTVAPSRCEENEKLSSDLALEMTTSINDGMQQQSIQVSSEDDLLGQCMVADELLQGHGLSWVSDLDAGISELNAEPNALKRPRTSNVESESKRIKSANELAMEKEKFNQRAEILAFRIEEELFKLFGGVNKKYKEKGRSLLFNLKDKSNPELRERVLSGDIVPERLCSMTAEELASKELSEWRLAKAEEFAQMVVLPTMEVDPRRLVRKTHKGEFQVEVEEPDGFSVEVELGSNVTNIPSKAVEDQTKSNGTAGKVDVQEKDKASDSASHDEDGRTGNNGIPVGTPQEDVNDSDELDTTMEPSDLPETEDNASAPEKTESKSDKSSAQVNSEHRLESPGHIAVQNSDLTEPRDGELSKSSPSPDKDEAKKTTVDNASNSDSVHHNQAASLPMIRESIWEGAIQLTVSSLCNVVAIFKSGEKPSLKDWRSFIEIKGRVKLSAFQEFVDQLPKSKSRAIMITELCWKEGSSESGRQNILQTIDAYISDERVGLAEPAEGIELYLCPPHGKTVEILSRHLPKEHQESLAVAGSSFIGVVVWRRPSISRAPTSHHNNRHDGSKRQSILGKPQVTNPAARPSLPPNSYGAPPGFTSQREEEDVTDDAPPGFGPGVARDEDDLPEFNFVKSSHHAANVTAHAYKGPWPHVPPPSARPAEQMRELVQKYGKRSSVQEAPRAWDDDDDDIPEWNPTHQTIKQPPLPHAPQQLPLPPPPVQQMNAAYQQQYHIPSAVQPQVPITSLPHAYLRTQQPQPGQAWQQPSNAWWPAQGVAAPAAQQPQYGVVPGSSGVQGYDSSNAGGMAWRPR
uniref:TFIIS central domain-containing protein n=1 Tax=Zea mays TaxID=4577 RepID=A0A804PHS7_MAIZE